MSIQLEHMPERKRNLAAAAVSYMDNMYDKEMKLLRDSEDLSRHNTRGSGHYALGLLLRGEPGDTELACSVLNKLLDMQYDAPEEIYHGTFKSAPQDADPPRGNYPWKRLGNGHAYFLAETFEQIGAKLADSSSGELDIEADLGREDGREAAGAKAGAASRSAASLLQARFAAAVNAVLPPVWQSYDPNWREFISCIFAVIFAEFEHKLPSELVARMDGAMVRSVGASIDRRLSDAIPMNSNIELMHIFMASFYGDRYGNASWTEHARREADSLLLDYVEFGAFAEFNSSTYYGVDLTVLGLWRTYGRDRRLQQIGSELEEGLWRNIADFYNPELEELSGPFSRGYEMAMTEHSSLGVFIYLLLGDRYKHLTRINCESEHDVMIALAGVQAPESVRSRLTAHSENRLVVQPYRELCERNAPGDRRHVCTVTAWIESKLMIGGIAGSRNRSGQLHPATLQWRSPSGDKYSLRLLRRRSGGNWGVHVKGVSFEAVAEERKLAVAVEAAAENLEFFWELEGKSAGESEFESGCWTLPGLTLTVAAEAPAPVIRRHGERVEVVYATGPSVWHSALKFAFELHLHS